MDETQVLEFYKQVYFFEHDRRNILDARLTLPVGVVTLLAGGVVFFFQQDAATAVTAACVILVSTFAAAFALIVACVYFVRTLYNHTYHFMPTVQELETHRQALVQYAAALQSHYAQYPNAAASGTAPTSDERFRAYIVEELCKGSDYNARTNARKSGFLHRGNSFLVLALVLLLVCVLTYAASI